MRLALVLVAALAVLPARPLAQERSSEAATPAPVPKADAGPESPPKADTAPRSGTSPQPEPAPKAEPGAKAEAPAKPPPAAATDLARALLTKEQWSKVLDSYSSSLASQISQALMANGEKVPDDLRGRLRAELEKALPYQQTVQAQAQALAQELTPDELRRTANFYSSPLGRKVLDRLPEAQSTVAQQLQGRLATAVPEIVNRVAPKALAGSPHGGGAAPGNGSTGSSGTPPPVQGRRPPSDGGATH